jgi:hypothetical protein
MALGGPATSYRCAVDAARVSGATDQEVVGTMIAVAPSVGLSRLISATVAVGLAVGYDIDAALESRDPPANRREQPRSRR